MSKETRDNLVKLAKSAMERSKVGIRRTRQKGISEARKAKGEVSDDDIKRAEKQVLGQHCLLLVKSLYLTFNSCSFTICVLAQCLG